MGNEFFKKGCLFQTAFAIVVVFLILWLLIGISSLSQSPFVLASAFVLLGGLILSLYRQRVGGLLIILSGFLHIIILVNMPKEGLEVFGIIIFIVLVTLPLCVSGIIISIALSKEEKKARKVLPKHRRFDLRGASLVVITVLVITLFTGGMAYGMQNLTREEAAEGVMNGIWREFRISAQQWYYEPSIIRVDPYNYIKGSPGDRVRFILTSQDLTHGFAINELGVNLSLSPGAAVIHEVVIPQDMPDGTYAMYCSIFCGIGHPYLKGKMIVGTPTMLWGIGMEKILPYFAISVMAGVFAVFIAKGRRRVR